MTALRSLRVLALLGCAAAAHALAPQQESEALSRGLEAIQPARLEADLMYLACDEMRGRDTPSNEQRLAARFLVNRVTRLGLQPGGRYGYLSEYPLDWKQIDEEASFLQVGETRLAFGRHYVFPQLGDLADSEASGGMVSVGEGGANDLRKADLIAKWAVAQDDGGSQRRLVERVKEAGAAGLILLPKPGDDVLGRYGRALGWMTEGRLQSVRDLDLATVVLTPTGADAFMAACGASELPDPGKALRGEVREVRRLTHPRGYRHFENVAAWWPGSDPELSKEVLIVSAHYDHVGVGGGRIYNGADDNGSGTTGLLGIAEALSAYGPMKRSVLLLWVSGEEKGLLGSRAWTQRPWLPEGCRPVANINIDMIGRNAPDELLITPTKSGSVAKEYNALVRMAEAAGPKEGFRSFKSADEYWRRSDHMNFADNLGLPVTFLFADVHEDYHKPTDDPFKIDYDKMSRIARLVVRVLDGLQEPELDLSPRPIPVLADFEAQMRRGMLLDDLERLRLGADLFARAEGRAPRSLDELRRSESWTQSGLERPGLGEDPWGREYRMDTDGGGVVLSSYGADGRKGGEGEDADTEVR
jgi:hypothetical protein